MQWVAPRQPGQNSEGTAFSTTAIRVIYFQQAGNAALAASPSVSPISRHISPFRAGIQEDMLLSDAPASFLRSSWRIHLVCPKAEL